MNADSHPIAVVCAGNRNVYGDCMGLHIYEKIKLRYKRFVEVFNIGCIALALLDCIDKQKIMFIIDAYISNDKPGSLKILKPDYCLSSHGITSTHQTGPLETLCVANRLYPERLPDDIRLILINTQGITEILADRVCNRVIALLDSEIESWRIKNKGNYSREGIKWNKIKH
ncbi:MAG: hydrogenase maturation protease [Chitinispirillia bacterium]|jgi:hydrogenase maturation protease